VTREPARALAEHPNPAKRESEARERSSLFVLLRVGLPATAITDGAVRSYRTFSPYASGVPLSQIDG